MRIGEVATRTGTPIKTIRYYEEIGVLSAPTRSPSGYRDFNEEVIDRLHFIRSSKAVGFSLNEIREIVIYRERGEIPCVHVLKLLERHRDDVAERLTALEEARVALDSLLARASKLRQENCSPNSVCHLIPKRTARVHATNAAEAMSAPVTEPDGVTTGALTGAPVHVNERDHRFGD